jgi:hypothetical protein
MHMGALFGFYGYYSDFMDINYNTLKYVLLFRSVFVKCIFFNLHEKCSLLNKKFTNIFLISKFSQTDRLPRLKWCIADSDGRSISRRLTMT